LSTVVNLICSGFEMKTNFIPAGIVLGAAILFAGAEPVVGQIEPPVSSGLRLTLSPAAANAAVSNAWLAWKTNYLQPSVKVAGDYKVNFDRHGTTVSEAMGYGMVLAVYMAGADPAARQIFDGLNHFRKRFPSDINPALMCWKIPPSEKPVKDDCATDGDLDMAFALVLASQQWSDPEYLTEATNYLNAIAASLVRPDFSLRLGDWNDAAGQTRPSDFMPVNFRAFYRATGDGLWTNVENRCYAILEQLQTNAAPHTGLVPDFAVVSGGLWKPARPRFLEGPHDGQYYYNSCRVPWRIGWAANANNDDRARKILARLMTWTTNQCAAPIQFRAGYKLDGSNIPGNNYDTDCFIAPTGVAAAAVGPQAWLDGAFSYAAQRHETYYEDSVGLLSLLVMANLAWSP
jgi:endo-1,4-beta-D-glucanase Y